MHFVQTMRSSRKGSYCFADRSRAMIARMRNLFYIHRRMEENKMSHIPTIDMVKTGKNIIKLRKQAGLSVKDLQDIFGFATPQAIYKWQQGVTIPTVDNLVVLAAIFHVHVDDILVLDVEVDEETQKKCIDDLLDSLV